MVFFRLAKLIYAKQNEQEIFEYVKNNIEKYIPRFLNNAVGINKAQANNDDKLYDYVFNKVIELIIHPHFQNYESLLNDINFKQKIIDICQPYIDKVKQEYIYKHSINNDDLNIICAKLYKYVLMNLKDIIENMDIPKSNAGYNLNWIEANYDIRDLEEIYDLLEEYLSDNIDTITLSMPEQLQSIFTEDYDYIIQVFLARNTSILKKIRNEILKLNAPLRNKRAEDLLKLEDKINDDTTIDFDVFNDNIRDRPIIIVQDVQGKDYVLYGHIGDSHSRAIKSIVWPFARKNKIELNPSVMGYGYLLGKIAFVDLNSSNWQSVGYTNDELVDILKKQPKIDKVYSTPPDKYDNVITRLATIY